MNTVVTMDGCEPLVDTALPQGMSGFSLYELSHAFALHVGGPNLHNPSTTIGEIVELLEDIVLQRPLQIRFKTAFYSNWFDKQQWELIQLPNILCQL